MEKMNQRYMQRALRLAGKAALSGEVPVGSVIVSGNKMVAEGWNEMITRDDPTAHAEILALRQAGARMGNYRLLNSDLYVTLEPCIMCYAAMVHARIRRLYFGAFDDKSGIFSTGKFEAVADIFNHDIVIRGGVLESACSQILKDFFKIRRGAGVVERDGLENR